MSDLIKLAESTARKAHQGQFRRDGVTPYINHPEAVANSLQNESDNIIAAAWLHDVIEDSDLTVNDLWAIPEIPTLVVRAVDRLTKTKNVTYAQYIETISRDQIASTVKIADILHNLSDSPTNRQKAKYAKALQILGYKEAQP